MFNLIKNFNNNNVFCIIGPTLVGKSFISMELYKYFPFEIISVDSALVYKFMNIGTDKPSFNKLKKYPHRLIDIIDPKYFYSVNNFFFDVIKNIYEVIYINKKIPLLVGGTMMYYNVLFNGLNILPKSNLNIRNHIESLFIKYGNKYVYNILNKLDNNICKNIHFNDKYRIMRNLEIYLLSGKKISFLKNKSKLKLDLNFIKIVLLFDHDINYINLIKKRLYRMLNKNFKNEVLYLYNRGDLNINNSSIKCIGYKQMWLYIDNKINYINMINEIINKNLLLIKNQFKWIKKWYNNSYIVYNNIYCLKNIINYIESLI